MKKRASGGRADYYEGGNSEVAKEAAEKEQKKHGGRVKEAGKAHGGKVHKRLDKRARGGKVGSDKAPFAPGSATHPFTSAAK